MPDKKQDAKHKAALKAAKETAQETYRRMMKGVEMPDTEVPIDKINPKKTKKNGNSNLSSSARLEDSRNQALDDALKTLKELRSNKAAQEEYQITFNNLQTNLQSAMQVTKQMRKEFNESIEDTFKIVEKIKALKGDK